MLSAQPLYLGPTQGLSQTCFAVLHGVAAPRQALLYLQAPGEELNHSRAAAARLAERLAACGWAVLLLDLPGCGDSEGELHDDSWTQWQQDAAAALAWLRVHSGRQPWLAGLRASALLAASLPLSSNPLLLWHPPTSGAAMARQLHRQMRLSLRSGDGPTWPPRLLQTLEALPWPPPDGGGRTLRCVEASTDGQAGAHQAALQQAWQEAGWSLQVRTVVQAPFWATPEPVTADAFVETSLRLLGVDDGLVQSTAAPPELDVSLTEVELDRAVHERALRLNVANKALIGLISQPLQGAARAGLVLLVGGPQVRTGAHRLFTRLARQLAVHGVASVRLDLRGMGDSPHGPRDFQNVDAEIQAAAAALRALPGGCGPLVLLGLCDGASAALLHVHRGNVAQAQGLALINPWVDDAQAVARARVTHHYLERLTSPAFWLRALRGGVRSQALREAWQTWRHAQQPASAAPPLSAQLAQALLGWPQAQRPLLLLLSGADATAQSFSQFLNALPLPPAAREGLVQHPLPGADHTLSTASSRQAAADALLQWLEQRLVRPVGATA
jgi:uncharacterized protein